MNKIIAIILLILTIFLLTSCKSISREEAIEITQAFVNEHVRFYVADNEAVPEVQRASITVLEVNKEDNNWNVFLHVESNQTGELKQADLFVIIDAKEGNVINWSKLSNEE
jgi:hypothetical protein